MQRNLGTPQPKSRVSRHEFRILQHSPEFRTPVRCPLPAAHPAMILDITIKERFLLQQFLHLQPTTFRPLTSSSENTS